MASIASDPGNRKRIIFLDQNNDRKTIWLGRASKGLAEQIKIRVAAINAANIGGAALDHAEAEWLSKIAKSPLYAKLVKAGLVAPREPPVKAACPPLGAFLRSYIDGRTDHAPNTKKTIDQARLVLVKHFGEDKPIDAITAAGAEDWHNGLRAQGYKPATIATHIKKAKQMFGYAVSAEILVRNPFAKLKAPQQVDKSREEFIDHAIVRRVIDAAPDAEWRLIIALSRFGGLRCPSEHLALTWADVDWERGRFRVDSPKTGVRWVPIFPELRPYLDKAFELAPPDRPGEQPQPVINRYRDTNQNLRTQFQRIIRKAHLEPWGRLFHNLRSSRQTELMKLFPAHVVCAWIGNTERIANRHYLQLTDEDYARAATMDSAQNIAPHIARNPKTAQNTAMQGPRSDRAADEKTPENPGFSANSSMYVDDSEHPWQESNLHTSAFAGRRASATPQG